MTPLVIASCTGCQPYWGYWKQVTEYHFDASPSGERVLFTAEGKGGRDLYLLDLGNRNVRSVTNSPQFETEGHFLTESKLIASAVESPNRPWSAIHLYQIDTLSGVVRQITTNTNAQDVRIIPLSENEILFDRARLPQGGARVLDMGGGVIGTFILNTQTGVVRFVMSPTPYDCRAVFANRRQLLMEDSYLVPNLKIITLDKPVGTPRARTTKEKPVADKGHCAALSPDERFVYYVEDSGGSFTIVRLHLHTGQRTVVAVRNQRIVELQARREWLFFLEGSGTDVTLWRVDTQGKRLEKLLTPSQFANPLGK
jgi:Tol biopolymer transport system component